MCRDEEPDVDPSDEEEYLNYMHEQENPDIEDEYPDDNYYSDDDYYPDDDYPNDDDEDDNPDLEDQFWEAMDKDD